MAVLEIPKKRPYWEMTIGGQDFTNSMHKYINSISIEYNIKGIATASIDVKANSSSENMLVPGQKITIKFGYHRLFMVDMFEGQVVTHPEGKASEMLSYKIVAADKSASLAFAQQRRTFPVLLKSTIVIQIAAFNSYIPVVDISDAIPIPADKMPIQFNKTDLDFLFECAQKWNCSMWFDSTTLYFVDSDKISNYGDVFKPLDVTSIKGLSLSYHLGYRLGFDENNIASISWKFKSSKTGSPGFPGVTGADESGEKVDFSDYTIEYEGVIYQLRPKLLADAIKNPALFKDYFLAVFNAGVDGLQETTLKEYYVPVTKGSPVNKDKSIPLSYNARGIECTVELNKGDPYLRPPRTAVLDAGSIGASDSYLPDFLFKNGLPTEFKITKVTTSLSSGMIRTKLVMNR
jgi:hypothetical protein